MTIYVITLPNILARNIAYRSDSRITLLRGHSYLFGGIMWHNGNSKWEPIYVSLYKQCHFHTDREFIFKPDTNNNRYAKRRYVYPTVLLPGPQNARAIYLPAGFYLVASTDICLCVFLWMQQTLYNDNIK